MMTAVEKHAPVLLKEALEYLSVRPGGIYADCTLGMGGHAAEILRELGGSGMLIGLDRDPQSLQLAQSHLADRFSNLVFYPDDFRNLPRRLRGMGLDRLDGCLVDLGISRFHVTRPERGFSFREEGPLDMRMDQGQELTAEKLVNRLPEKELAEIFRRYGEEPQARKLAAAIADRRRSRKFRTTLELAELVSQVKGHSRATKTHPATQVFQALRVEVNQELIGLEEFFSSVIGYLGPGCRLVVISFHSLEDRIVKKLFQLEAGRCICFKPIDHCTCPRAQRVKILTRKPVRPSSEELEENPSSRSAKLRAIERARSPEPD